MSVHQLLDLLLPDRCVLCDEMLLPRPAHLLCDHCWQDLPHNTPSCLMCALPLDPAAAQGCCANCQPVAPEYTLAALKYQHSSRYLVHQFKFHHSFRAGEVLVHAMARHAQQIYAGSSALPQLLLPVPLSRWNQFRRGYNQAQWLARRLARVMRLQTDSRSLVRQQQGTPQRLRSQAERLQLPASTFRLRHPPAATHVAIIDDVLTTGRTCAILRQLLHQYDVSRVDIWCASRALI